MSDNTINPEDTNQDQTPEKPEDLSGQSAENEESDLTGEQESKSPEPEKPVTSSRPVLAESDNRISLIDRNNLQVLITTKKGVRIFAVVRDKSDNSEIQSDEIFLPPKTEPGTQEAEIVISIKSSDAEPTTPAPAEESVYAEGRFLPKLIDETHQKIIFELYNEESVSIGYEFRDRKSSSSAKRYKNFVSAKEPGKIYEVEITVKIELETPAAAATDESESEKRVTLIPNPEVAALIQPPVPIGEGAAYFDDGRYKNPFDSLRALIRRNTIIGITIAVALHLAGAAYAFFGISKRQKPEGLEEPQRLIVIQDLPDPKIRLENVEDPNKPPPAEEKTDLSIPPKRTVPPRNVVQPPKVNRPKEDEQKKDTTELSGLSKELDSLRRLGDSLLASDTSAIKDTTSAFYSIPDSIRNNFSEGDIGLGMYFPNNWKLIDEREINKNEKVFRGVLLTDTTAQQPGTMTIFIHLDRENKGFSTEEFTNEFTMLDTNLTAFSKPPETQAAHTKYEFYVINNIGTEKLSVKAEVRKEFFDKYKNDIEAVVRSINIKRKQDLEKKEDSSSEESNDADTGELPGDQ